MSLNYSVQDNIESKVSNADQFHIFNPITREMQSVPLPPMVGVKGRFCGFFFHALTRKYKILYLHGQRTNLDYYIHTVGTPFWRKLASATAFSPRQKCHLPVAVNDALHWMIDNSNYNEEDDESCANSILVFKIDTEDFAVKPHPGERCDRSVRKAMHCRRTYLLEREGRQLCFCDIYRDCEGIRLFILEDYLGWGWVMTHRVDLIPLLGKYIRRPRPYVYVHGLEPLKIENDELVLVWSWEVNGIIYCHLEERTVRRFAFSGRSKYCFDSAFAITESLIDPAHFT